MKKPLLVIGIIFITGTAWYLGSPLLVDSVVEEEFPAAQSTQEMMKMMENLTEEQVDAMPIEKKMEMKQQMDEISQQMPDSIMEDKLPESTQEEPLQFALLAQGAFQGADGLHKGEGSATAYAFPDGSSILRFEDFSVTNGPALSVFLTKTTDGTKGEDAYDLGKLKGNKGNQNYDIPANIDLSDYESVLIYCVPFKVPFASAVLQKN